MSEENKPKGFEHNTQLFGDVIQRVHEDHPGSHVALLIIDPSGKMGFYCSNCPVCVAEILWKISEGRPHVNCLFTKSSTTSDKEAQEKLYDDMRKAQFSPNKVN